MAFPWSQQDQSAIISKLNQTPTFSFKVSSNLTTGFMILQSNQNGPPREIIGDELFRMDNMETPLMTGT